MKKIILNILSISILTFTACNNSESKTEDKEHDMNTMNKDTALHVTALDDKEIKTVTVSFTNVDAKLSASIKEIVDHYLHIKNGLAGDNADEAASGAKLMRKAISRLDKSLFTAEQKKVYDEIEEGMKEHTEHIGKNADKIKHQRFHFVLLSKDIYTLVKAFGAGRTLYHDHCPMARDNQGAMWISEIKEVKNPYFGSKMLTCGTVEEVIK